MEGLTGPLISFIGAVLIGIVVGKYIACLLYTSELPTILRV